MDVVRSSLLKCVYVCQCVCQCVWARAEPRTASDQRLKYCRGKSVLGSEKRISKHSYSHELTCLKIYTVRSLVRHPTFSPPAPPTLQALHLSPHRSGCTTRRITSCRRTPGSMGPSRGWKQPTWCRARALRATACSLCGRARRDAGTTSSLSTTRARPR